MSNRTLHRTPLFEAQTRHGGRFIPFGGWEMPVQFSGILEEHHAVRNAAGLFDISHMGQVRILGKHSAAWLNGLLTNDVFRLEVGASHYTFLLNNEGGVIDDLILYRTSETEFFLVINASAAEADLNWLRDHMNEEVILENLSPANAAVALQGPLAGGIFEAAFGLPQPDRRRIISFTWNDQTLLAGGTGYTGEDGCEIFFPSTLADALYDHLLETGSTQGLKPCGLGARDTLRLEMSYPLNGSDLSSKHTPLEAGLGVFVSFKKADRFPGRDHCEAQRGGGVPTHLSAIELSPGSPPPRPHYKVFHAGIEVAELSSGVLSPSLNKGIAMAYLPTALSVPGTILEIQIRQNTFPATVVPKPFYKSTAS